MKRRRKKNQPSSPYSLGVKADEQLHFRLCHVCLHLNESESDIEQCQRCQRYLTIENLVEEKLAARLLGGEDDEDEMDEELMEGSMVRRKGGGLNGLAVRW